MANKRKSGSKHDQQWSEAKRRCRLNLEDIRMAKELGLTPRSLIKNIPSPHQHWKLPVKQWIHELYEEKTGKSPQNWDDDVPLGLSESTLYWDIRDENQRAQKRQDDFRLAAQYVAQAFGQIAGIKKVVLFGSVACPLREEKPRYRNDRRAGMPILHTCNDIDLAVWLSDSECLRALQQARSKALNKLWQEHRIGVAHHQVDVFIMEPGSDRYLGRLCTYNQCPKGKPECRVTDCGSTPLLRQHEGFELNSSALTSGKSTVLI